MINLSLPEPLLKEAVSHELKLRFFDQELHFRADSERHIATFGQIYHRFQVDRFELKGPPLELILLARPDNPWGKAALILPQEVRLFNDPAWLEWYVYHTVLNEVLKRVRSHFLLHAGVVAYKGQGVIIAANSTYGKTTLTLELVRRGFDFLTDESAALGRADKQVHPFPRTVNIRPGTLELIGLERVVPPGAPTWLDKLILDIETLRPNSLGEASPISHIVILQDPDAPELSLDPELRFMVDHLDEAFIVAVSQLKTVKALQVDQQTYPHPFLELQTTDTAATFEQVEALAQRHRLLLSNFGANVKCPNFKRPVRLDSIPRSLATRILLNHFQGGHKSALLQTEFGGSGIGLFMELAALISGANCYKLSVGPLTQAANLICELVGL
jgi:hypothetical protein